MTCLPHFYLSPLFFPFWLPPRLTQDKIEPKQPSKDTKNVTHPKNKERSLHYYYSRDCITEALRVWNMVYARIATQRGKRNFSEIIPPSCSSSSTSSHVPEILYIPTSYRISAIARSTFLHPRACSLIAEYSDKELSDHVMLLSKDHFIPVKERYAELLSNPSQAKDKPLIIDTIELPSIQMDFSQRIKDIEFTRSHSSIQRPDLKEDIEYQALTEFVHEAKSILYGRIFQSICKIYSLTCDKFLRPILAPLSLTDSGIPEDLHDGIGSLKGNVKTLEEARIVLLIEMIHGCSIMYDNMRRFMRRCLKDRSVVLLEGVKKGEITDSEYLSLIAKIDDYKKRGIAEIGWDHMIAFDLQLTNNVVEKAFYMVGRNISLISTLREFANRPIYIDLGGGHVYDPLLLHALHDEKVMFISFKNY